MLKRSYKRMVQTARLLVKGSIRILD